MELYIKYSFSDFNSWNYITISQRAILYDGSCGYMFLQIVCKALLRTTIVPDTRVVICSGSSCSDLIILQANLVYDDIKGAPGHQRIKVDDLARIY